MEHQLSLRYAGPAVEAGQMDVYETSANMIAFSQFVVEAAKTVYGETASVQANVQGFNRGSFVTDFVIHVVEPAVSIYASAGSPNIFELVSQAFDLWKFLQGEPPKKITNIQASEGSQVAAVENNNGQIIQVKIDTLNLVLKDKAADAVQKFVRGSLSQDGIDGVEIKSGKQMVATVSSKEAKYFVPVKREDTVTDAIIRMTLMLEAAVFKDDNKWRFYDGQKTIFANMEDKEFLARIDNGELFAKGDIMVVDLRIVQKQTGSKIVAELSVMKVVDHRRGAFQNPLL